MIVNSSIHNMITFSYTTQCRRIKAKSLFLCRGFESSRVRLNCLFLLSLSLLLAFLLTPGHRGDSPPPLPTHALSRIGRDGETGATFPMSHALEFA